MTRLYMLDTNMVSYILKGKSAAARSRLESLRRDEIACISAVTEAELRYGLAKSYRGEDRQRSFELFLARLAIYPWGRAEAAAYGPLRARQEALGRTLGPLDMQIAAHAVAAEAILVTNDKAFQQVSNLIGVENWAVDLKIE